MHEWPLNACTVSKLLALAVALWAGSSIAAVAEGASPRINAGKAATGSPDIAEMNQFAGTWKCVQTPQIAGGASYTITAATSANGKIYAETSAHFARRFSISSYDGTLEMIATQDNGDFDVYKLSRFSVGPFDVTFTSELPYLQAPPNSSSFTPTYEIMPYNATVYTTKQTNSEGTTTQMQCTKKR